MYFALQFVDILARGIILVSLNVPSMYKKVPNYAKFQNGT